MAELQAIEGGRGSGGLALSAVSGPPAPAEWQAMKQQASVIEKSGLAPKNVNTPEKVLVIAMKGRELHIPPMQALSHIHIVEGKPTLSAELMTALVRRAGHKIRVVEWTDDGCVLEGVRADDPGHAQRTSFTAEEAQRAGLLNKTVWKSYRQAMLFSRATSKLCRSQFADVLMGASYTPEELGAEVNEEGEVLSVPDRTEATRRAEEPVEDAEVVEEGPASEKQSGYLKGLMRDLGANRTKIEERHGPVEEWPADKVSSWIDSLQERKRAKEAEVPAAEPPEDVPDAADSEEGEEVPDFEDMRGAAQEEPKPAPADLKLLRALADDVHGEREAHLEGHQWLQRELGTPFEEMTLSEVHELIEELNGEQQA